MTPEMWGIFLQIVILLAFGYFFTKKKILTSDIKNGLSTLLLKLVLPISILGRHRSPMMPLPSAVSVSLWSYRSYSTLCSCLFCVWWQRGFL